MLFYEIKIKYARQTGECNPSNVKETYLVEGLTCADAENRLLEEIKPYIFGDYELVSCKKVNVYEMIQSTDGDMWYKVRVEMIVIGENGSESRKAVSVLVKDSTIHDALRHFQEHLNYLDFEIVSITRSQIIDVYHAVN